MARYRLKKDAMIGGVFYAAGSIISLNGNQHGNPDHNMEKVEDDEPIVKAPAKKKLPADVEILDPKDDGEA